MSSAAWCSKSSTLWRSRRPRHPRSNVCDRQSAGGERPAATGQPRRVSEEGHEGHADSRSLTRSGDPQGSQARGPRPRQRPRRPFRQRARTDSSPAPAEARALASRVGRTRSTCGCPSSPGSRTGSAPSTRSSTCRVSRRSSPRATPSTSMLSSRRASFQVQDAAGQGPRRRRAHQEARRQGGQGLRRREDQDRGSRRDGRDAVITAIANAFRVPELRKKILFTLAIIALYRVGAHIPVPGVDIIAVQNLIEGQAALGLLNLFSGGALEQFAVFSLGIMPYITASIIMQLLQGVVPTIERVVQGGRVRSAQDDTDHPLPDARHRSAQCSGLADRLPAADRWSRLRPAHERTHRHHAHRGYGDDHVDGRAHHTARYRQRHVAAHLREHRRAFPGRI